MLFHNDIADASCAASAAAAADNSSTDSKCYKMINHQLTWYYASNDCLSRRGSLAVFTDHGRPSDDTRLTDWLNKFGTDRTYWIGLIRSWWKTTEGNNGHFAAPVHSYVSMVLL